MEEAGWQTLYIFEDPSERSTPYKCTNDRLGSGENMFGSGASSFDRHFGKDGVD